MASSPRIKPQRAKEFIKNKLNLDDSEIEILSDGPNSLVILDKKNKEIWKIPHAKSSVNIYLEEHNLNRLPENQLVLKHTRIESVVDDLQEYHSLIFPYVSGDSIYERIKKIKSGEAKPFILDELKMVGNKISESIALLNKYGLIHQDIKPANIILADDGSVKLIDLGIAQYVVENKVAIKKLEGPYAYLSPEKIGQLSGHSNWHELTFGSDLYSLGAVLFEMVKLTPLSSLVPLDELYSSSDNLKSLGIKSDYADYIGVFLNKDVFNRQLSVSKLTGVKWWNKPEPHVRRLWIHSSQNVVKETYPQFLELDERKSPIGLIYNASQASKNLSLVTNRAVDFQSKGHLFALDPSTYLQQNLVKFQRGLKNFEYGNVQINPENFTRESRFFNKEEYVDLVLDAQNKMNADILISPYFYVSSSSDEWMEASFYCWRQSAKKASELGKDIFFGIMLSENLLRSKDDIKKIAVMLSQANYINKIYIKYEAPRSSSSPLVDELLLSNLRDLVSYLSESKIVILSGGIEALGLLGYGLNSISTNPEFGQRKFSLKDKLTIKTGGGQSRPRYFVRLLLNEILIQAELVVAKSKLSQSSYERLFSCDCAACPNQDTVSLKRHFLFHYDDMFNILSKLDNKKSLEMFKLWLRNAYEGYSILESFDVKLDSNTNGNFISVWENIL